jgi:hypothetical protein
MGAAGVVMCAGWTLFRRSVIDVALPNEQRSGPGSLAIVAVSLVMVVIGYVSSWILLESDRQISLYVVMVLASLIYLTLFHSKQQILAFILIGISGVLVEWILLDPDIGYYEFRHADLFGRVPAWEPFVYGWAGLFIHELSLKIDG